MRIPTVAQMMKLRPSTYTKGEVGLEIECEGRRLPQPERYWDTTRDDSLRDGLEYVLKKPLSLVDAKEALKYFGKQCEENNTLLRDSIRTAVHVHINVQDMTIPQLFNFVTLYLIFEGVLMKQAGRGRDGNLFCLKANDAEYLPAYIVSVLQSGDFRRFDNDDIRYASMNLKALTTYGSLEFRGLKTPHGNGNMRVVYDWVETLICLRDAAMSFTDPVDVMSGFSNASYDNFLAKIFGTFSERLFKVEDWQDRMKIGMRIAQDVAFSVNWANFNKPVPTNPFKAAL